MLVTTTTTAAAADEPELVVWTSTALRAIQTADLVRCRVRVAWNALTEIDAGACESMTYAEIQAKMPLEFAERSRDKYHWRYPRGESYADVVRRLESVIFEIERIRRPVLVVAHRAVVRCLLGYFQGLSKEVIPYVPMPLHSVVKLTTGSGSTGAAWRAETFKLSPDVGDAGAIEQDMKRFRRMLEEASTKSSS